MTDYKKNESESIRVQETPENENNENMDVVRLNILFYNYN